MLGIHPTNQLRPLRVSGIHRSSQHSGESRRAPARSYAMLVSDSGAESRGNIPTKGFGPMQMPFKTDPRQFLQQFRRNYVNLYNLWSRATRTAPEGLQLHRPAERPIRESEIPGALKRLVDSYLSAHPGAKLALVKHMRVVNGTPELVIEDESELPPDEEFISFSQTLTLNTADSSEVITELFVGRRV